MKTVFKVQVNGLGETGKKNSKKGWGFNDFFSRQHMGKMVN